jgi:hypothetical protein
MDQMRLQEELIDSEIEIHRNNPMGCSILHLIRGLFGNKLHVDKEFRAASIKSRGDWKFTQIYLGQIDEDFNINPSHLVLVAEDSRRQLLQLHYMQKTGESTQGTTTCSFFDFEKIVNKVAFFLLNGHEMSDVEDFALHVVKIHDIDDAMHA